MTRLLVSVRDSGEAEAAASGGANLLDVKEPLRGSLGSASPQVWQEICRWNCGRLPLSAALGELHEAERLETLDELAGYAFAKTGLAGCRLDAAWPYRWQRLLGRLPRGTAAVAVVYADWRQCQAPAPQDILRAAADLECGAVLMDTHGKDRGDLFSHLGAAELSRLIEEIRARSIPVVLAGSLGPPSIAAALALEPDYIAVRGAACEADRAGGIARTGRIDGRRVKRLAELLAGRRPSRPARDGSS